MAKLQRLPVRSHPLPLLCVTANTVRRFETTRLSHPDRPRNHSKTLPFHDLFMTLFDPLIDRKIMEWEASSHDGQLK